MNIQYQTKVRGLAGVQRAAQHRDPARFRSILIFTSLMAPASALAQSGGGYAITKSTIRGGGGTETGGDYKLSGTVGQHNAADVAGGSYSLQGGFWSPVVARPESPTPDSSGLEKSRFISFSVPASPLDTALRVRLVSLHHVEPPYAGGPSVPFTSFEGQVRWVGQPSSYLESTSNATQFYASSLQCTPEYWDWNTVGLLHVFGSAIVPSSVYEVENVSFLCVGAEQTCTAVSVPLVVSTTRWGDVETPYAPPNPSGQPDFGDISALVNKFKSQPGAPIKARALLAGDDAFGNITNLGVDLGFGHIAACVDAFKGKPYPHTIEACPAPATVSPAMAGWISR